jgi:hypothetical protein
LGQHEYLITSYKTGKTMNEADKKDLLNSRGLLTAERCDDLLFIENFLSVT